MFEIESLFFWPAFLFKICEKKKLIKQYELNFGLNQKGFSRTKKCEKNFFTFWGFFFGFYVGTKFPIEGKYRRTFTFKPLLFSKFSHAKNFSNITFLLTDFFNNAVRSRDYSFR